MGVLAQSVSSKDTTIHCSDQKSNQESTTLRLQTCALIHWAAPPLKLAYSRQISFLTRQQHNMPDAGIDHHHQLRHNQYLFRRCDSGSKQFMRKSKMQKYLVSQHPLVHRSHIRFIWFKIIVTSCKSEFTTYNKQEKQPKSICVQLVPLVNLLYLTKYRFMREEVAKVIIVDYTFKSPNTV